MQSQKQLRMWEIAARNFLRMLEVEALRIVTKAGSELQDAARGIFNRVEGSIAHSMPLMDNAITIVGYINEAYSQAKSIASMSFSRRLSSTGEHRVLPSSVEICHIVYNFTTPFCKFLVDLKLVASVGVDAIVTILPTGSEHVDIKIKVGGIFFYLENIRTSDLSIDYKLKRLEQTTNCIAGRKDEFFINIDDCMTLNDLGGLLGSRWNSVVADVASQMVYVLLRLFTSWDGTLAAVISHIDDVFQEVGNEIESSLSSALAQLSSVLHPYIFAADGENILLLSAIFPTHAPHTSTYTIPMHVRLLMRGAGFTKTYEVLSFPLRVEIKVETTERGSKLNRIATAIIVPNYRVWHPYFSRSETMEKVMEALEGIAKSEVNFSSKPLDISTYQREELVTLLRNTITSLLSDTFKKFINFIYSNVSLFASTAAGGRVEDVGVLDANTFTKIFNATPMSISSVMSGIALGVLSSIDVMQSDIMLLHSIFYRNIRQIVEGSVDTVEIEREPSPRLWVGGGVRHVSISSPSVGKTLNLPPMWLGPTLHLRIKTHPTPQGKSTVYHASLFFSPAWVLYSITAASASAPETLGCKFVGVVVGARAHNDYSPLVYKIKFISTTHSDEVVFSGSRNLHAEHNIEVEVRNISVVGDVFTKWWQKARRELQRKVGDLGELLNKLLAQMRFE